MIFEQHDQSSNSIIMKHHNYQHFSRNNMKYHQIASIIIKSHASFLKFHQYIIKSHQFHQMTS